MKLAASSFVSNWLGRSRQSTASVKDSFNPKRELQSEISPFFRAKLEIFRWETVSSHRPGMATLPYESPNDTSNRANSHDVDV